MNIKGLLNKLLGREVKDLILPASLETVPMRDKLDEEKTKRLDEFKQEYIRLLNSREHVFSYDLTSEYFNDEMLMNFTLFGKIIMNHEFVYNPRLYHEYDLLAHQVVNPIKIKIYVDKMEKLYVETLLRLIALKEIYDEVIVKKDKKIGLLLSSSKKSALVNEINNLTTNYIIFKSNVFAALTEVNTYKRELDFTTDYSESELEEELKKNEQKVRKYINKLMPDKLLDDINNDNLINRIAYLERELEIYTYKNLKIDDLNKELEELDKVEKIAGNRQMLLDKINMLEYKFLVLNEYGKYELDLKPLYDIKFDILTIDLINQRTNPFLAMTRATRYKYVDAFASRLETYILGNDSLLSQWLDEDEKWIIPIVSEHFRNRYGNTHMDLLRDKTSLLLALSMKSREDAVYFFNNYKVNFADEIERLWYYDSGYFYCFNCDETADIPFSTLCKIYALDGVSKFRSGGRCAYFGKIYDCLIKGDGGRCEIPEGIKTVSFRGENDSKFINKIREKINNKSLIMPKSLERLDLRFFDLSDLRIPKIVLNEGLCTLLGNINFKHLQTVSLTIPSSLLEIRLDNGSRYYDDDSVSRCSPFGDVRVLIFTNFEFSQILRNKNDRAAILASKVDITIEELKNMTLGKQTGQIKEFLEHSYTFFTNNNTIILWSTDNRMIEINVTDVVVEAFKHWLDKAEFPDCYEFKNRKIDSTKIKGIAIQKCDKLIKDAIKGKHMIHTIHSR